MSSLWDKIKGAYNWVDENVADGKLPWGSSGGPQVGDVIDTRGMERFAPGGTMPGAGNPYQVGGVPPTGGPGGNPIVAGYQKDKVTPDTSEGIGRRVGGWLKDNADLVVGGLGVAASLYSGHQAGQVEDRRLDLDEEMMRSDASLAGRELDLRQQGMEHEWEEEETERKRRRQALLNVMRMRAAGQQPPPADATQMET